MKGGLFSIATLLLLALASCEDPSPDAGDTAPVTGLTVETRARGSIERVGQDTLGAGARIVSLEPESDGEAVAVVFADSVSGVSAGLAIEDQRSGATHLLWPDSVTNVWWSEPHTLSFTTATGRGAYVVVDVHAAALEAITRADIVVPPRRDSVDQVLLGRAQQYIDSVHVQPGGVAETGAMTYTVTTLLPDPGGALAAFHVTARDTLGRELNPSWYVMHVASGRAALIDEIVGAAAELPRSAGGWTRDSRFIYAKGPALHQAAIGTLPSGSPLGGDTATR